MSSTDNFTPTLALKSVFTDCRYLPLPSHCQMTSLPWIFSHLQRYVTEVLQNQVQRQQLACQTSPKRSKNLPFLI